MSSRRDQLNINIQCLSSQCSVRALGNYLRKMTFTSLFIYDVCLKTLCFAVALKGFGGRGICSNILGKCSTGTKLYWVSTSRP